IGKRFSEPVLRLSLEAPAPLPDQPAPATATPISETELADALRTLQRTDLIHAEPDAGQYAFKHPLTQEVAYGSQLQEARLRWHETVAHALERVYADRLGEHAALLAHHWQAAGKHYEARLWRGRAALQVTNIQLRRDRARRS